LAKKMIQVIVRAVDIINILSSAPEDTHGLGEIAAKLGLNNGTCANILKTLVDCGCVEQPERKKGYRLGPKIFQWAGGFAYREDLVAPARSIMANLRDATNENVILAIVQGGNRVIIWEENSSSELQVRGNTMKPLYASATGRVVIAFMSNAERLKLIEQLGFPDKTSWPEAATALDFEHELMRIKGQGIVTQETDTHIFGMAVPLWRGGKVVAALGMYLPASRGSKTRLESLKKDLIQAGLELSRQLDIHSISG
jgi:DNA-binding IclR family transcriptional regulator